MLVSVVIPTYNRIATLRETIESVFVQDYRPIEIIVVDDGSTDATGEYIESLPRPTGVCVKLLRQQRCGPQVARNAGFRASTGDFIQFLDSDDVLAPNKFSRQITDMVGAGEAVSYCRAGVIENGVADWTHDYFPRFQPTELVRALLVRIPFNTVCCVYSRTIVETVNLWDEELQIWQDLDFNLRVVLSAKRVFFCDEILCAYRIDTPDSISTRGRVGCDASLKRLNAVKKLERVLGEFDRLGRPEREWLAARYRGLATHAARAGNMEVARYCFRKGVSFSNSFLKRVFCRIGVASPPAAAFASCFYRARS